MRADDKQLALNLIASTRAEFEASPWWTSGFKADNARRSFAKAALYRIENNVDALSRDIAGLERILHNLKYHFEDQRVCYGISVGYKRPGPARVVWVHVNGEIDPEAARKLAAQTQTARRLMSQGYKEYGVSSLTTWRMQEPVAQADHSSPSA